MTLIAYLYDGSFIDSDFELGRWTLRKDLVHKQWAQMSIPFELNNFVKRSDSFYLLLIAHLGGQDPEVFLAIDDLSVDLNYECRDAFECEYGSRERVSKDRVCDFIADCGAQSDETTCAACTFESTYCGYTQTRGNSQANEECGWYLSAANKTYGPKHAVEGSDFLMTRADLRDNDRDGHNVSTSLTLYSPWLQNSSPTCGFGFYYAASYYAALLVSVETVKPKAVMNIFDSRLATDLTNVDADRWSREVVVIGQIAGQFRLRFQAHYSEDTAKATPDELRSQFVGIDAVRFTNCHPDRVNCYTKDAFACTNGNCVSSDAVCDHVDDCKHTMRPVRRAG